MQKLLLTLVFMALPFMTFANDPASIQANTLEIQNAMTQMRRDYFTQITTKDSFPAAQTLDVVTFNAGLLRINLPIIGFPVLQVPHYEERSEVFKENLETLSQNGQRDIIFLQEVWHGKDIQTILAWSASNGYVDLYDEINRLRYQNMRFNKAQFKKTSKLTGASLNRALRNVGADEQYLTMQKNTTGLNILIKRDSIERLVDAGFIAYRNQAGEKQRGSIEAIAGYERGLLFAKLLLKDGRKVLVGTSHLSPLGLGDNQGRKLQLESLANIIKNHEVGLDLSIIGADFNVSPLWENQKGGEISETAAYWDENALNYSFFAKQSGMYDVWSVLYKQNPGYTQDRMLNELTAASGSTEKEPEQRLDYLWVKSNKYMIKIFESDIEMMKEQNGFIPSDHFGVSAQIQ